jgi:hypothetical protein
VPTTAASAAHKGKTMKVFISWSGDQSKEAARVLKEWLPAVIQAVRPYFSPVDIEKGARWSSEIAKELGQSGVGIICLTKGNLTAPWIMFEAGALATSMEKSRVVPLLLGVDPSELSGPLAQFQASGFNKEEMRKLLKSVNSALPDGALETDVLNAVFEKWWPDLESRILSIFDGSKAELPAHKMRTERELLEEILEIVRSQKYEADLFNPYLLRPIQDLDLTNNLVEILHDENIYYIGDLAIKQPIDLLKTPKMSNKMLKEITTALSKKDIELGKPISGWPPTLS